MKNTMLRVFANYFVVLFNLIAAVVAFAAIFMGFGSNGPVMGGIALLIAGLVLNEVNERFIQ